MAMRNQTDNILRGRPIGEVAKDLTSDLSLLLRQEIELAKAEMAEKGRTAARGLGMLGGAAVIALCAAGSLTAFSILVFSLFLPEWAAALVVSLVLGTSAYVLVRQGKERVGDAGKPVPEQTIDTMKEDVEWVKTRASSARK
jgi:hypothetical protein